MKTILTIVTLFTFVGYAFSDTTDASQRSKTTPQEQANEITVGNSNKNTLPLTDNETVHEKEKSVADAPYTTAVAKNEENKPPVSNTIPKQQNKSTDSESHESERPVSVNPAAMQIPEFAGTKSTQIDIAEPKEKVSVDIMPKPIEQAQNDNTILVCTLVSSVTSLIICAACLVFLILGSVEMKKHNKKIAEGMAEKLSDYKNNYIRSTDVEKILSASLGTLWRKDGE